MSDYKKYPDVNEIRIIGRLTVDPTFKTIGDTAVLEFSVANNRPRKNNEDFVNFFRVKRWGKNVDKLLPIFHKGTKVLVIGPLDIEKFTIEGVEKTSVSINANTLEKFADPKPKDNSGNPNKVDYNDSPPMPSVAGEIYKGSCDEFDDDIPL